VPRALTVYSFVACFCSTRSPHPRHQAVGFVRQSAAPEHQLEAVMGRKGLMRCAPLVVAGWWGWLIWTVRSARLGWLGAGGGVASAKVCAANREPQARTYTVTVTAPNPKPLTPNPKPVNGRTVTHCRFWDCCGDEAEDAPGCCTGWHVTFDDEVNAARGWK